MANLLIPGVGIVEDSDQVLSIPGAGLVEYVEAEEGEEEVFPIGAIAMEHFMKMRQ